MNTTAEVQEVQTDVGEYKRYRAFEPGVLTGATEVWKDIEGYEGHYQVSSFGQIKSVARITTSPSGRWRPLKERTMSQKISNEGYYVIGLSKNSIKSMPNVHKLVANAFVPNPDGKDTINHKDGNKLNNHVSNLEWATRHEQMAHAFGTGLINPYNRTKFTDELKEKVQDYYIETGCSIRELCRVFGIKPRSAGRIVEAAGDKLLKRVPKPIRRPNSNVLTPDQYAEVVRLYNEGIKPKDIAKLFNRCESGIYLIVRRYKKENNIV